MPPPVAKKPSLPAPPVNQQSTRIIKCGGITKALGHRAVLYGPGGIGKTSLACLAKGPVAFVDSDESLPRLEQRLKELDIPLPVQPVDQDGKPAVKDWASLRQGLQSDGWAKFSTIVIDSITKVEEWSVAETLRKVKKEGGSNAHNIEDYGFGKGYQHNFDTFCTLLGDLDRIARQGINVILIAHECVNNVPNPEGPDWSRYEPRLQSPSSGKASIRLRLKEWADHVLFLGYDVVVKDGVGSGQGTKTLYTSERPHFMAKSRTTQDSFPIGDVAQGAEVLATILR